jgi:hypothetical protein
MLTPVQTNVGNLGNGGTGTVTFANAQTAKNCNTVFVYGIQSSALPTITSVTDSAGNTYSLEFTETIPSNVSKCAIYMCASINAHAAGNVVTVNWTGNGYVDARIAEWTGPFGAVTAANGNSQYGGTHVIPNVTLTGTNSGDAVFAMCCDGNFVPASGNIGGTAASWSAGDPPAGGDAWIAQAGPSPGGTISATFGTTTDDNWACVAVSISYALANNAIFFNTD